MLNLLNTGVGEYLRENVVLTVLLALILALIAALSGIMIYLQIKAKKTAEAEQTADGQENADGETTDEATDEAEEAKEEVKEEVKEAPVEESEKTEEKEQETQAPAQPEPENKEEEKPAGFQNGKWIINKTEEGKFVFKLCAANGSVMFESGKEYASLSSAKQGINTYKKNFAENNCKVSETKTGGFVYKLTNANGMLLSVSTGYTSKSSCENALESTKAYAESAPVEVQ